MKATIRVLTHTLLSLVLLPASLAFAMCVETTPHLAEVEVLGCEAPESFARERFGANRGTNPGWGEEDSALQAMLSAQPARLLAVRLIRHRVPEAGAPWKPYDSEADARVLNTRILLLGSNDCPELATGSAASNLKLLLERSVCCDTGPSDLVCLLGLPVFEQPPQQLLQAAGSETAG
jgi:hypothetical protein